MNFDEIPQGLHSLQYGAKICEETLGLPAIKSNLELIGACIDAVAKKMFRGRQDELKVATYWLIRRLEAAQSNGEKITTNWLRNGEYWNVDKPREMPSAPHYEHHGQGYNMHDIEWLIKEWVRAKPEDRKTEPWYEANLTELDKKRGGPPAFRVG